MKKLFACLVLVGFLLVGCESSTLQPKECAYCQGNIYWQVDGRYGHSLQCQKHDGKYYHPWCYKILVDAGKLK